VWFGSVGVGALELPRSSSCTSDTYTNGIRTLHVHGPVRTLSVTYVYV